MVLGGAPHHVLRVLQAARHMQLRQLATAPLAAGMRFTCTKQFSPEEVLQFLKSTGDANPIHVDKSAAKAAGFDHPILPGILLASLFPAIIGSHFPGAVYATQSLAFKAPATVGSPVHAEVTVTRSSGSRVTFDTRCFVGQGDERVLLVEGTALALVGARTTP